MGDQDYRKQISKDLELEFSDEGLYELSRVAGGSSFEGTSISAERLHEEIAELRLQIFGETEALKKFYEKNDLEVSESEADYQTDENGLGYNFSLHRKNKQFIFIPIGY